VKEEGVLELFEDDLLRRIGEQILETAPGGGGGGSTAADVISSLGDADLERTAASLAIGEDPWDRVGCEKFIRQFVCNRRGNDSRLLQRIRTAEKAGDYELVMRLQMQLLKEKQALAQCK
jgi:DNA primase